MIQNKNSILASLSLFSFLYNEKKDIFLVISEFIKHYLALEKNISPFSISELAEKINQYYGFNLPSAVIQSATKELTYIKKSPTEKDIYIVNYEHNDLQTVQSLITQSSKYQMEHDDIFKQLTRYIETKRSTTLSPTDQECLFKSLCNFILDEVNGDEFHNEISAFLLENKIEKKEQFQTLREGVVLHSALKFNTNFNAIHEKWSNPLTIFLDTEIIFDLFGLNGSIYECYAKDFLSLVKQTNSHRRLINLVYFENTNDEIQAYFKKAEDIFEKNTVLDLTKPAMCKIVASAKNIADIQLTYQHLIHFLEKNGIKKYTTSDRLDHNSKLFQRYSIDSKTLRLSVETELNISETPNDIIKNINAIIILRGGKEIHNFENCQYIILTRDSKVFKIANSQSIKSEISLNIPIATNLSFITSRLWIKLHQGFGHSDLPLSTSFISKAQTVIAGLASQAVQKIYTDFTKNKQEYSLEDEPFLLGYIANLRENVISAEDVNQTNINSIMDIINNADLSSALITYKDTQNQISQKTIEFNRTQNENTLLKQKEELHLIEKNQLLENIKQTKQQQITILQNQIKEIENDIKSISTKIFSNSEKLHNYQKLITTFIVIIFAVVLVLLKDEIAYFQESFGPLEFLMCILIFILITLLRNKPITDETTEFNWKNMTIIILPFITSIFTKNLTKNIDSQKKTKNSIRK